MAGMHLVYKSMSRRLFSRIQNSYSPEHSPVSSTLPWTWVISKIFPSYWGITYKYTSLTSKIKGNGMQICLILHIQVCDIKNVAHLFSLIHSKLRNSSIPLCNGDKPLV